MSERRQDLSEFAKKMAGKEAILCICSKPVARVRTTVEVRRQPSDSGQRSLYLQIECEVIPTPGLRTSAESPLPVFGASCEILSVSESYVAAAFTHMEFYFDPAFIETIVEMVAELPPGKALADDYTSRESSKLARKFNFVVVHSPGPVARRVGEYVQDYRKKALMGDSIRLNNR